MPELYPFQAEGVTRLVSQKRFILGDDMGTGKTAQALAAAAKLDAFPCLIVCPKSATGVWKREVRKWLDMEAVTYAGQNRRLGRDNPFVIVSYALFHEISSREAWRLTIFDEAHRFRNGRIKSKANKRGETIVPDLFKWAKKVQSPYVFMLTGSPVVNDADDLWPMLHLLNPFAWRSYWAFVKKYMHSSNNGYGWKVEGLKDAAALRQDIERYFLRRKKTDVLLELPEKRRDLWPLKMTKVQRTMYDTLVKELVLDLPDGGLLAVPSKIALLTRLRQLLVTPRILGLEEDGAALTALVEQLKENPHPALVFTPFAEAIPYIKAALDGQPVYVITGKTPNVQVVEEAFDRDKTKNKVLISTVQMGTSWAATSASTVYFLGMDWAPDINIQAEDRSHRHGQLNGVMVWYFSHANSFDVNQLAILERKTTIKRLVINADAFLKGEAIAA